MLRRPMLVAGLSLLALLPAATAGAGARLVSVVPFTDGCVAGPIGTNVEVWDVEAGQTYAVRIDHVVNCSSGGTDPTITILASCAPQGNVWITGTRVAVGIYEFLYTVPRTACEATPIRYGVVRNRPDSGFALGRHDTGMARAQLQAVRFSPGCSNPVPLSCATPTRASTWGMLKSIYR